MIQSATATAEAIDVTAADAVAAATQRAAEQASTPAENAPALVPVSRALGGPRRRRRSDQRWQVTEADLNMYALITGRPPSEAERVAALTGIPNEQTALRDAGAGTGGIGGMGGALGGLASRLLRRPSADDSGEARSWSPATLYACLRDVYYFGAHLTQLRVTRPQFTAWVRHVSVEARRRLLETQARFTGPRGR